MGGCLESAIFATMYVILAIYRFISFLGGWSRKLQALLDITIVDLVH